MRFIITAAPGDTQTSETHTEAAFDEHLFAAYMKFNEDMHRAGVLIASEGLNPAAKGARVGIRAGKRAVMDGPFAETKELLGGFYIIEVPSLEEAVGWALRCPVGFSSANVLDIRALTDMEDIPNELLQLSAKVAPEWTASVTAPKR